MYFKNDLKERQNWKPSLEPVNNEDFFVEIFLTHKEDLKVSIKGVEILPFFTKEQAFITILHRFFFFVEYVVTLFDGCIIWYLIFRAYYISSLNVFCIYQLIFIHPLSSIIML